MVIKATAFKLDAFTAAFSRQLRSARRMGGHWLPPVLVFALVFVLARPIADDSRTTATIKRGRAQQFADQLRRALAITQDVQIGVVSYDPLVFSVEPLNARRDRFVLSMELGFLLMLDDDELRAAVAHELGHVWIYTHHPFLQTERLANTIAQNVVNRSNFEKIYSKLWAYEGTTGVPIDDLLGPVMPDSSVPKPVTTETRP